jgi:hypothetical protein
MQKMQFDPRTVARDIPGIFDEIFPQLTPGIVAYFNDHAEGFPFTPIPPLLLERSEVQRAMLFELGYAVAESLLTTDSIDWNSCFKTALVRQKAFYDAKLPASLGAADKIIAEIIGKNLAKALKDQTAAMGHPLVFRPFIPGLEWISTGRGDFAAGRSLIEVKCTNRRFSASDYRQVAIYWLLSYAASIEGRGSEWHDFILLNPRLGFKVSYNFDKFLSVISSGRTKVDILQLFMSLIGSRLNR